MSIAHRAPAGSRRFWIVVLCFAVANAGLWVLYDRVIQPRRHPLLNVLQFTPGDRATVNSRPILEWSFNLDVAPPAANAPAPGQISPPVAGKWEWKGARTLTFEPVADLPAATPFTISLGTEHLRTPEGFRLAKPYVCSVLTDPLSVISVTQSAFDETDHLVLAFAFSDKVIPADLQQHLTISGSDERPVKFHLFGEATGSTVRIMTDSIGRLTNRANAFVQVHISPGLAGASGPLGLEAVYAMQVPVTSDLQSSSVYASSPASEEPSISLNFNNPVDLAALREVISIEPAAKFSVSSSYSSETALLQGGLQPGTRYSIKIAKAPAHSAKRQYPAPTTLTRFCSGPLAGRLARPHGRVSFLGGQSNGKGSRRQRAGFEGLDFTRLRKQHRGVAEFIEFARLAKPGTIRPAAGGPRDSSAAGEKQSSGYFPRDRRPSPGRRDARWRLPGRYLLTRNRRKALTGSGPG